jgi:hypothetical protein
MRRVIASPAASLCRTRTTATLWREKPAWKRSPLIISKIGETQPWSDEDRDVPPFEDSAATRRPTFPLRNWPVSRPFVRCRLP